MVHTATIDKFCQARNLAKIDNEESLALHTVGLQNKLPMGRIKKHEVVYQTGRLLDLSYKTYRSVEHQINRHWARTRHEQYFFSTYRDQF